MLRRRTVGWLTAVAALTFAAPADAYVIETFGTASATNGIALGPDGNFWVSETFNDTVARVSPAGTVIQRLPVGSEPQSIAVGPGGRVWVAVTGDDKLVWIDATSASPSAHDVSTAGASDCGPVGIVSGGNGSMYFSMPNDGSCAAASRVGRLDANEDIITTDAAGTAFDLEVAGGSLWVPGAFDDVVFKLSPSDLTEQDRFDVSGSPDGITADSAGNVWVTLYDANAVARIAGGAVTVFSPSNSSTTLLHPFGIVAGADGFLYVLGSDSNTIQRVTSAGQFTNFPIGGTHQPWQIVNGPDGDVWFTDFTTANLLRFVSSAPRASTGAASALGPTSASFGASVNPRGNETQVVFDYGPTTAYGSSTAPVTLPAGTAVVPVSAAAQGLPPGSTLHVRVRATNAEGGATGADVPFTTPPGDADGDGFALGVDCNDNDPAIHPGATEIPGDGIDQNCGPEEPTPLLAASTTMTWKTFRTFIVLKKVRVDLLRGGERIVLRCKGRGCPFKTRTVKKAKKGKRNFGGLFKRRKLRAGAKLTVTITRAGFVGRVTLLTVRRGKDPKFVKRCLPPGAKKPTTCS